MRMLPERDKSSIFRRFGAESGRGLRFETLAIAVLAALWSLHFLAHTVRLGLGDPAGWSRDFGARTVLTCVGAGLAYLLLVFLRRLRERGFLAQFLWGALASGPVALLFAALNVQAFSPADTHASLSALASATLLSFVYYFWLYLSWSAAVVALSYSFKVAEQEKQAAELRAEAQAALLRALRYQISPHLLFNTLNSIASLIVDDPAKAEEMVLSLSTLLRTKLAIEPVADVTLAEEIDLQKTYLEIERIRFPDRLAILVDVEPGLWEMKVPSLILQPLVENAIKHGVARSDARTTVRISAARFEQVALITVVDDAFGSDESGRGVPGLGLGLTNVADRLRLRYGSRAELRVDASPPTFTASLHIPLPD